MIAEYVGRGQVLPPEVIFAALEGPINEANGQNPIILDGFPRKLDQAAPIEAAVSGLQLRKILAYIVNYSLDYRS